MICCSCDREIDPKRLEILPDTRICSQCAYKVNPKRVKGVNVYSHKTAPEIHVMSADYFDTEWRKYNPKFGRGSGIHKMSPRIAGSK